MLFAVKPSSNSLEKTFGFRLIAPTSFHFWHFSRARPTVFRNQTGAFWRPAERCKIAAGFYRSLRAFAIPHWGIRPDCFDEFFPSLGRRRGTLRGHVHPLFSLRP